MSDELTRRLRELAEGAEAPPRLPGAVVRAAAGRRRHRRRTAAFLAGGCAAATLAAVLTAHVTGEGAGHGTEQRSSPLASPGPGRSADPSPGRSPGRDVPYVTVDLSRRVLTAEGRELPLSAGTTRLPPSAGLMTVTGKESVRLLSSRTAAPESVSAVRLRWVLELAPLDRTGSSPGEETGTRAYIASALTDEEPTPGDRGTTVDWISLRPTDAAWLYQELPEGAVVEIVAPTEPATARVTPTTAP
ncbi:murein L,D-transpeptidase [Streptomyces sp. HM190]|uniref:murein L,D-transpeptidase n=1 Tax=Streptomyces sp. HM190 TaxID=2695266 RepID=UPI00135A9150|nr:murein L,D-transpeptidase [Streptomyces sp. HM190]